MAIVDSEQTFEYLNIKENSNRLFQFGMYSSHTNSRIDPMKQSTHFIKFSAAVPMCKIEISPLLIVWCSGQYIHIIGDDQMTISQRYYTINRKIRCVFYVCGDIQLFLANLYKIKDKMSLCFIIKYSKQQLAFLSTEQI